MNKIYKALKVLIVCAFLYFLYSILITFYNISNGHKPDVFSQVDNLWIFKNDIKEKIYAYGSNWSTKRDELSGFRFDITENNETKRYFVKLWKFKDIRNQKINRLYFNFDVNLNKEKEPVEYEILDNKGDFSIVVKYDYDFERGFNLNFPKSDSIVFYESKKELKYVYGKFDFISITNGKNEEQIVFRNMHSNNYIAFFIFRKHKSNYLAIVHSDFYFDKEIAKIFTFYK